MKTTSKIYNFLPLLLVVFVALSATSCSNMYLGISYDDVYGGVPSRAEERQAQMEYRQQELAQEYSNTVSTYGEDPYGTYYSDSSAFDTTYYEYPEYSYDDYYDYEYSSRLRRFHEETYIADGYYNDYYTNSYWYNYDPFYYGTSIYSGYNWWYPSYNYYRPSWYIGLWGPSWYSPYGWGSGYWNGYNNGYWNGYWDGYYGGNLDYCYNPYDKNTYNHSEFRRGYGSGSNTNSIARLGNNNYSSQTGQTSTREPSFPKRYEMAIKKQEVSTGSVSNRVQETTNPVRPSNRENLRVNSNIAFDDMVHQRLEDKSTSTITKPIRNNPSTAIRKTNMSNNYNEAVQTRTHSSQGSVEGTPPRQTTNPVRPSRNLPVNRVSSTTQSTTRSSQTTAPTRVNVRPSSYTAPSYGRSGVYRSPQSQRQTSTGGTSIPARSYTPTRNVSSGNSTVRSSTNSSSPVRSSGSSSSSSRGSSGGSSAPRRN